MPCWDNLWTLVSLPESSHIHLNAMGQLRTPRRVVAGGDLREGWKLSTRYVDANGIIYVVTLSLRGVYHSSHLSYRIMLSIYKELSTVRRNI